MAAWFEKHASYLSRFYRVGQRPAPLQLSEGVEGQHSSHALLAPSAVVGSFDIRPANAKIVQHNVVIANRFYFLGSSGLRSIVYELNHRITQKRIGIRV